MEEESVSNIRETSRNTLKLSRRFHRDEESDFRRSVASSSIKPEVIEEIANKLKTKASVSVEELRILKNGLMEDPKYIEVVLNVNGALRGLVRELSGIEVRKQCAAAGCFCNLALGDGKAASAVVKAAGPYLVAAIDNLSTELAVTCIWSIGNLAGSSSRVCSLLLAQGAFTKLCDTLTSQNEEMVDAAVYALGHFAYQMKDELSTDHLSKIFQAISKTSITLASSQLLFILSCHQDFRTPPDFYLQRIVEETIIDIRYHILNCKSNCDKNCKVIFLVRTLANIEINDSAYSLLVDSFLKVVDEIKVIILKESCLEKALLWLLGNLFKFNKESLFFNELLKAVKL